MGKEKNTFYLTTAISYPNGEPHIGHAYEAIITDTVARYHKIFGKNVMFLTGTDEHGIKMLQTAKKNNLTAKQLADKNAPLFMEMLSEVCSSHNDFIRTTENRHKNACIEIWNRMLQNDDIYKDKYAGWYSIRDEAYYEEKELTKKNGQFLSPQGTEVTWVEEESYFFRLSKYQDRLLDHYKNNPKFILPESRKNEVIKFVESGLKDLSISRTTFDWGVRVPNDNGHVMYVWVDALTNYLTGINFPNETYKNYWPANYHIIGKDILRFHAVYWPAFLLSAKIELPVTIFAHGFLFNRGIKMSKSLGNVISPSELIAKYGIDQLRYFFLREVSMGNDGNYDDDSISKRINADLANDLGNLIQRSCSMVIKNCDGIIPSIMSKLNKDDIMINSNVDRLVDRIKILLETLELNKILSEIWEQISNLNKYFSDQKPWELRKDNNERMQTVLFVTLNNIRKIAIMLLPVIPTSSEKILNLLNVDDLERNFKDIIDTNIDISGNRLGEVTPVFPKVEISDE
tara:strand:- start:1171 stop:2715 length:1545 start_codon:yes stop_codon:yes gene_type:complete